MRYAHPPLSELEPERATTGILTDYLADLAPKLEPLGIAKPECMPGCDLEHAARLLAHAALGPTMLAPDDVRAVADAVRDVVGDETDAEGVPTSLASTLARAALVRVALAEDEDLTTSDVACVLGISAQRVRQLAKGLDRHTNVRILERAPGGRWQAMSCRRLFRNRGTPWPELQ